MPHLPAVSEAEGPSSAWVEELGARAGGGSPSGLHCFARKATEVGKTGLFPTRTELGGGLDNASQRLTCPR